MLVVVGFGASAFQIDPAVVTQVSTAVDGLWIPVSSTGEIVHVDATRGEVSARVVVGEPGAELEPTELDGAVIVVDRTAGVVSLVDPALHEVVRTVSTLAAGPDRFDVGPGSIVVAEGSEMSVIDLQVTQAASFDAGRPVGSIAALGVGGVVATDEALARFGFTEDFDPVAAESTYVVRAGERVITLDDSGARDFESGDEACVARPLGDDARMRPQ